MRTLILALVLALPVSVQAQARDDEHADAFTHALIAAMLIGHGMDLSTTVSCVAIDTCVELNPLLKPLVRKPLAFGAAKTGVSVGISAFLLKYHGKHKWPARILAGSMAGLLFYQSAKNATLTPPRTTP